MTFVNRLVDGNAVGDELRLARWGAIVGTMSEHNARRKRNASRDVEVVGAAVEPIDIQLGNRPKRRRESGEPQGRTGDQRPVSILNERRG